MAKIVEQSKYCKIIFRRLIIIQDEIAVLEISDPWSGLDPFKMMLIKGNFSKFLLLNFCKNV